ncbi:hypothetical protein MKX07_008576 [Trichoderma sp. CBMAI-0711]|nr:hypothetical protein MKX07_008576 [Trichoderma sp. CBMAI-0711]
MSVMSFSSSAVTVEGRRYSAILAFVVVAVVVVVVVVVVQELKCRTPLCNRIKTLNDDKTPFQLKTFPQSSHNKEKSL